MRNEATIGFVREHREEDVRALALQAQRYPDVDMPWALDQIQGWQMARRKLPTWANTDGIIYPPHLSMEQCSSEQTAKYKCSVVDSLPDRSHETLIDLTGGFGVDFAFMATRAIQAVYVERMEHLCETARHNFGLLELNDATVINDEAEKVLDELTSPPDSTLIYLDPARRDNNNARTYAITDCTPNVIDLKNKLLNSAHHVLIKLSPMLDWHKAVNDLGNRVAEVHIVSTNNECKELFILMSADHEGEPSVYCVNDGHTISFVPSESESNPVIANNDDEASYLYEPNASIMKAGCFGMLTRQYPVKALAADSHLFISNRAIPDFPGRCFAVTSVTSMNKKELSNALRGITRANVAIRNFPLTAQQLRKRLHLNDGGECYIFGTTTASGEHTLFICKKLGKT